MSTNVVYDELELPWVHWPWPFHRRCRAVLEKRGRGAYWGRCDLRAGHECDHALERGFDTPRWSTTLTGF